jgi:hypothetical protein
MNKRPAIGVLLLPPLHGSSFGCGRQEAKAMVAVSPWAGKPARRSPISRGLPVDRRIGATRPSPGVILAAWVGAVFVPWAVLVALVNLLL